MFTEITFVGPNNEEIYVHFDVKTKEPLRLYAYKDNPVTENSPVTWVKGLNALFVYAEDVKSALDYIQTVGYQLVGEEQDWLENQNV